MNTTRNKVILNTTFIFSPLVSLKALSWVKYEYRDLALKNGAENAILARIIGKDDECSYALHLVFADLDMANQWLNNIGDAKLKEMTSLWGEHALSFVTFMETIE